MSSSKKFSKTPLAIAIGSIVAAHAGLAGAQESGANVLEEIVVTATRREQATHDIPFNISAITGDQIAAANIVNSDELLRFMPGVTVPDGGARLAENNNIITMRGLNIDPSATDRAFLSDPTVSTYVGETPVFANFVLRDMNRVEVLRGPQGTLYGSGSLGGTVRFIPNLPNSTEFEAVVEASYGQSAGSDGNNYSIDALVNIPLSDTFAFRASVGRVENAGVIDYANVYATDANNIPLAEGDDIIRGGPVYVNDRDADKAEVNYGRAALRWTPNDRFDATLTYMAQDGTYGGRRQSTSGPNGWDEFYNEYEIGAVVSEPAESKTDFVGLEIQYDLGFATLSSSTSRYDRSYDGVSDNTGFFAARGWLYWYGYTNWPRPAYAAERQFAEDGFIQEIRLASNGEEGNTFDWVVGGFYLDQSSSAAQQTRLRGFQEWHAAADPDGDGFSDDFGYIGAFYDRTNNISFDWTYSQDFKDLAFFGEVTFHASETVDLTLGARRFDNEQTVTSQTAFPIWFIANPVINEVNKDSDTLFKGNIAWNVSDSHMIYGTISEGYRRGGTNAAPVRPDPSYPNDPEWAGFGSDSVVNYELGIKGRLDRFSYTAAAFLVDWSDPQLNVATPSGAYYAVANGDKGESKGLETEFQWLATDSIRVFGGYTYVDASLTRDLLLHDADPDTEGKTSLRATAGARMPITAEHTLNLGASHTADLNNGLQLVTRVDGYYQSDVENSILNIDPNWSQTLDGFSIWNLSATLRSENWSVTLYGKNLFNEKGQTAIYKEEYMTSDPSMNFFGTGQKDFIARTRTVALAASYRF